MKRFFKRVLSRLHYELTGLHPNALKEVIDNYAGTISALITLSPAAQKVEVVDLFQAFEDVSETEDGKALGELFARHGSDKSTRHNYHLIYAAVLKGGRNLPLDIFEIGLGTNNPKLVSTMGKDGKPGASLRSFRDWAPNANVYGADIDKTILFSEERIKTFFVDQTSPQSLAELAAQFPQKRFDLIIDDGLHNTWANLNSLNFALGLLKPGGVFVVEDVYEEYVPIWKVAVSMMDQSYRPQLVKTKSRIVCVLRKP